MPPEAASQQEIDFSRPFFPASMTALAFTPSWRKLDEAHRLRYSQLYALYVNEQTVFFEELLATTVLPAFYQQPGRIGADLAEDLRLFEAEERVHSSWFRRMNHLIDPLNFSLEEGRYHFVPVDARMIARTAWFARRPFAFPGWLWLMLLQEERSLAISRECLRQPEIEPRFLDLHRRHMADEVGHVEWDMKLIERVWLPMPGWKRRLHARLFGIMMAEFFTAPKRSALRVLDALISEFPDLRAEASVMRAELALLGRSRDYHASLYSRLHTPRCFALFDELPEFRHIGRHLLAYETP
jgi:hypothetical protein